MKIKGFQWLFLLVEAYIIICCMAKIRISSNLRITDSIIGGCRECNRRLCAPKVKVKNEGQERPPRICHLSFFFSSSTLKLLTGHLYSNGICSIKVKVINRDDSHDACVNLDDDCPIWVEVAGKDVICRYFGNTCCKSCYGYRRSLFARLFSEDSDIWE